MKQHITEEQWNELSDKKQKKLLKWSKTCESFQDQVIEGDYNPNIVILSIGQMIEFLYENVNDRISVAISKKNGSYISKDNFMMSSDFKDELADSLWEAVKRGTK